MNTLKKWISVSSGSHHTHQTTTIQKMMFSQKHFFKSSLLLNGQCGIFNYFPQPAATTFAFSSVFILLQRCILYLGLSVNCVEDQVYISRPSTIHTVQAQVHISRPSSTYTVQSQVYISRPSSILCRPMGVYFISRPSSLMCTVQVKFDISRPSSIQCRPRYIYLGLALCCVGPGVYIQTQQYTVQAQVNIYGPSSILCRPRCIYLGLAVHILCRPRCIYLGLAVYCVGPGVYIYAQQYTVQAQVYISRPSSILCRPR